MQIIRLPVLIAVFVVAVLLHSPAAHGSCGLSWEVPTNHFDGVNEQGYVSYWEKIGEVDLGNDLKLPLIVNFRSNRESSSPYLGQGWLLALLESNIFQVDENKFMMVQPDGLQRWFWRDKPGSTTLDGQGRWKAEIKGNTITAWATCGWKLSYNKGRIASITTPKSRKLEFVRSGAVNLVTEIRENGAAVLRVETDSRTNKVSGLAFNNQHIGIELADKPRVEALNGRNLIGMMDKSLNKLMLPGGTARSYEFAVNDKIQPTLKITNKADKERLFTWNPTTKQIASDNDWTYKITGANALANAAIGRTNVKKQTEYWFLDEAKGQETTQDIDGIKNTTSWFTSGVLVGKIRKKETTENGTQITAYRAAYDDEGHLIRELHYVQNQLEKEVTVTHNGKGEIAITVKEQGRIVTRTFDKSGAFRETIAFQKD